MLKAWQEGASIMQRLVMTVLFACLMAGAPAGPSWAADKLDSGLLDPAWFGAAGQFRITDEFDYLWVKDGFSLKGKTVRVKDWEAPKFLGKKRDGKDSARAFELTERIPGLLAGALSNAFGDNAKVSRSEGEIEIVGRFVDVNAGSNTAKWIVGLGAGSASATWDLKFVDKTTGELLAAIHHRSISGTAMSDIDDKIVKWMDEKLSAAMQTGLAASYATGKGAKK